MTRRRFLAVASGVPVVDRREGRGNAGRRAEGRSRRPVRRGGPVDTCADRQRRGGRGGAACAPRRPGAESRLRCGTRRPAVPHRLANQADDCVRRAVVARSARAGAERCGEQVPAGVPRRPTRRGHDRSPAHAHLGPARHAPGQHRTSSPARAPVRVRGSNLPDAAAFPTRDESQLPEHGHPPGRGDRREGQRRADAGIHGADDFSPTADAANVVGPGRSTARGDRPVPGAGSRTQRLGLEQPVLAEPRSPMGRRSCHCARSRGVPGRLRFPRWRGVGASHTP